MRFLQESVILTLLFVGGSAKRTSVEDVTLKELESLVQDEQFLAVYWYGKNCKTCDRVLAELEKKCEELEESGIRIVKLNDKKTAKKYGILSFPSLSFFKGGDPNNYEGDLNNEEELMDFLVSTEALNMPDRIEEVAANQLKKLIEAKPLIAVIFYVPHQEHSVEVINELELIDEKADALGVAIVKINDLELVDEYQLGELPSLVYYRNSVPIVYEGSLLNEEKVLEWIIQNRSTGEEDDVIEDVTLESLEALIPSLDHLAVLFYDGSSRKADLLLENLEKIDDECDEEGIHFVKLNNEDETQDLEGKFGILRLPALVIFNAGIPNVFDGNLMDGSTVLQWLTNQVNAEEIEEVTGPMLDRLIKNTKRLVVLFYEKGDLESTAIVQVLETIKDNLSGYGITMVKIRGVHALAEYGIDHQPAIVYFENGIPYLYPKKLEDANEILKWLVHQTVEDEIENVTDEMLFKLLNENQTRIGALFYTKDSETSEDVLRSLESIDDDCDHEDIIMVKMDDAGVAQKYGITSIPTLLYFEGKIPHLYTGNLSSNNEVLGWLIHQKKAEEIEEVTYEMLDILLSEYQRVSVLFYEKDDRSSGKIISGLETIDDDLDASSILLVKISEDLEDSALQEKFPDLEYPSLFLMINETILKYTGEILDEEEVLDWILSTTGEGREIPQSPALPIKTTKPSTTATKPIVEKTTASILRPKPAPIKSSTSPQKPAKKTPSKSIPESTLESPPKPLKPPTQKIPSKPQRGHADNPPKIPTAIPQIKEDTPIEKPPKRSKPERVKPSIIEKTPDTPSVEEDKEVIRLKQLKLIEQSSHVIGFFYDNLDKVTNKIIIELQKVEEKLNLKDLNFLHINANDFPEISVSSIPSLVYFKGGEPNVYEENMMNEDSIYQWILEEYNLNRDVIEHYASTRLRNLIEHNEFVLIYLYSDDCQTCKDSLINLEEIDDDTNAVGVKFVKTDDEEFIKEMGVEALPTIIYFENGEPSIYDGNPGEESELLTWLLYQMKEDTIENINREILYKMIGENEFLAVFFYENDDNSGKMLRHLELIDDEASMYGARIVKIQDSLMSKKYGHRDPPGLGYFRKGNYIKYDGDIYDDEEMLDWLTDPNIMEISDQIEKINRKMFEKLLVRNEYLVVLFYTETECKQCDTVLKELENIDDEAEAAGIPIVKLEDRDLAKHVGVFAHPSIVIFRNFGEEAVIYSGDIKNEDAILEWLLVQKDPGNEAIENLEGFALREAIEDSDSVAIFIYTQDERCDACLEVLQGLENIDDDAARHGIEFLKTTDETYGEEVGILDFPGLIYIYKGIPNIFEGNMEAEEEILDWLIEMKVEHHVELISRPILESMVQDIQYLAVLFIKQNCRTCDQIIVELEKIDDECDGYGIQMVKLRDPQLAKRYGIKTFPSLVYFRNGNPLTFEGDLKDEEGVFQWLINDDNRELEDEIEAVNFKMLQRLMEKSELLAVFFHDSDCAECEIILEELEKIDNKADGFGIDMVKNDDPIAAKHYQVYNTPALVYFRRGEPITYDGDLLDGEKVLFWLTSKDVFELRDSIEPVNRKLLDKLLDEKDFVAVYFHGDNCEECENILNGLEKVDEETEGLDITFVKVNDPRYAKKYGVNKLPSLVYFRRRFPSIYRESLHNETEVFEWLKSNRYKTVELDVFMYGVVAIATLFLLYTVFLHFGFRQKVVEKKKEE